MKEKKIYKVTLIIGNGFDLSLQLKTSYKNFHEYLEAKGFYEKHNSNELISRIRTNIHDYWYDFEKVIKDYAQSSKACFLFRRLAIFREILDDFYHNWNRDLLSDAITSDILDLFKEYDSSYVEKLLDKIDDRELSEVMDLCRKIETQIDDIEQRERKNTQAILDELKKELNLFLNDATKGHIDISEPSARVLLSTLGIEPKGYNSIEEGLLTKIVKEEWVFEDNVRIISFNYTDTLYLIAKVVELAKGRAFPLEFEDLKNIYFPIHGTLKEEELVFGADDVEGIPYPLQILKKSEQIIDYKGKYDVKKQFTDILNNSQEIIIFGHSINGLDFEYYEEYLKTDSDSPIHIITYDETSVETIKHFLAKRNLHRSNREIKYYKTNEFHNKQIETLCNRIRNANNEVKE